MRRSLEYTDVLYAGSAEEQEGLAAVKPKNDAELRTTWWRLSVAQTLNLGVPCLTTALVMSVLHSRPERHWSSWIGMILGLLISQILIGLFARKACTLRLYKGRVFLGEASGIPVRDLNFDVAPRDHWFWTLFGWRSVYGKDGRRRVTVNRLWYGRQEFGAFIARCREAVP